MISHLQRKIEDAKGLGAPFTDIVIDPMNSLFSDNEKAIEFKDSIPLLTEFKNLARHTKTSVWVTEHAKTRTRFAGKFHGFEEPEDFMNGRMIHNKVDSFLTVSRVVQDEDNEKIKTNQVKVCQLKAKYSQMHKEGQEMFIFNPETWRYEFGRLIVWDSPGAKFVIPKTALTSIPLDIFNEKNEVHRATK